MTAPYQPFIGIDPEKQREQERLFLEMRGRAFDDALARIRGIGALQAATATPATPATTEVPKQLAVATPEPAAPAATESGLLDWLRQVGETAGMDRDELIGTARAWGISGPEQIPADSLRQIVEARRQAAAQSNTEDSGLMRAAAAVAAVGTGVAEGVVDVADLLAKPLEKLRKSVPESLVRQFNLGWLYHTQEAKQWLNQIQEGVRMNLTRQDADKFDVAAGAAGVVGMFVPTAAIYKTLAASGAIFGGKVWSAASSVLKAGLLGAGTNAVLEVGQDKPWLPDSGDLETVGGISTLREPSAEQLNALARVVLGNRVGATAFGALTGMAFEAMGNKLATSKATKTPDVGEVGDAQWNARPEEPVDAEFYIEQDIPSPDRFARLMPPPQAGGSSVPEPPAAPSVPPLRIVPGTPVEAPEAPPEAPPFRPAAGEPPPVEGYTFLSPNSTQSQAATPAASSETGIVLEGPSVNPLDESQVRILDLRQKQSEVLSADATVGLMQRGTREAIVNVFSRTLDEIEAVDRDLAIAKQTGDVTNLPHFVSWKKGRIEERNAMLEDYPWLRDWNDLENRIRQVASRAGIAPVETADFVGLAAERAQLNSTPAQSFVKQVGTVLVDARGEPQILYSGTARTFDEPDLARGSPDGLFGPAYYMTTRPDVAGGDPLDVIASRLSPVAETVPNIVGVDRGLEGYAFSRQHQLRAEMEDLALRIQDNEELVGRIKAGQVKGLSAAQAAQTLREAEAELEQDQQTLHALSSQGPQVRAEYLAAKRIFYAFRPMEVSEAEEIINLIRMKYPEFSKDLSRVWNRIATKDPDFDGKVFSKAGDLYSDLAETEEQTTKGGLPRVLGKRRLNEVLADLGYDAIHYDGGVLLGTPVQHDAYAVLNTKALVPRFANEEKLSAVAEAMGVQLSKQGQVIESPALADVALSGEITDSDVAKAALAARPESIVLIRGLADPGQTVRDVLAGKIIYGGIAPKSFRLIEREGRIDLLVSAVGEISDNVAETYSKYGLFPGQRIISAKSGKEGVVDSIFERNGKVMIAWRKPGSAAIGKTRSGHAGKQTYPTAMENILPMLDAPQVIEAPKILDDFASAMAEAVKVLSEQVGHAVEPWGELARRYMPGVFDQVMDLNGITDPGTIAAMRAYVDERLVEMYREMAPDLNELDKSIAEQLDAISAAKSASEPSASVPELAAYRGFTAIPVAGGSGWIIEDQLTPRKFNFADSDAAKKFLSTFVREPLDMDPGGDVPIEVARSIKADGTPEPDYRSPAEERATMAADAEHLHKVADEHTMADETPPPSGSSPPPPPPGSPPPPVVASSGLPTGGSGGPPHPSAALKDLAEVAPNLHYRYTHGLYKVLWPWRVLTGDLESDLLELGIKDVRPDLDRALITEGMDRAHNEAHPLHTRLAQNIDEVGSRVLAQGPLWRAMTLRGAARARYMSSERFSNKEAAVVQDLESMLRDWLGPSYERKWTQLVQFVSDVQTAQLRGDPKPFGDLEAYPDIRYYAEAVKERAGDLRFPHAGRILSEFIQTTTFNKHVGVEWESISRRWNELHNWRDEDGSRPLAPFANIFLDWLKVVRYGYQPGHDAALDIVQSLSPIPITKREASDIINFGLNTIYRAVLGFRVFPIVRDATQPLLAIPRVGIGALSQAYEELLRGGDELRGRIVQELADIGVVQKGIPPVSSGLQIGERLAESNRMFSPKELARRKIWQRALLLARDMTPKWARTIEGTIFDPMWAYTNQNTWSRIAAGRAAQIAFRKGYDNWHQSVLDAIERGRPEEIPSQEQLLATFNGDSFSPAIRRRILDYLEAGDVKGAESAYVNEVVNDVMHRYGTKEVAPMWRGHTARIGLQLGNFTMQAMAHLRNALRYGSMNYKLRVIMGSSIAGGLLYLAQQKTGLKFMKYFWLNPLYAGGPVVEKFTDFLGLSRGTAAVLQGYEPQDMDKSAVRDLTRSSGWGQILNPAAGIVENVGEFIQAQDAPQPARNILEYLFTGEKSSGGTQYGQQLEDYFRQQFEASTKGGGAF